jgi:tetraacyldisaccharide 4'-kinase
MKAPRFWSEPPSIYSALLSPLGNLYQAVGNLRRGQAQPYRAKFPVLCIGNITAGGSGKTPTAIAIAQLLQDQGARPVFVTRGYRGTEPGPLRVDLTRHDFRAVGDEALLLARQAPCWIGRDRAAAIRAAEQDATHIILDDGLQNPHIKADYNLLVVDGAAGFGNGRLIPAGPLRETLANALPRLQGCLIIGEDQHNLARHITVPVFQGDIVPQLPQDFPRDKQLLAFAGIGRPEKFYETCRREGLTVAQTRDFPDHHIFTADELADLAHTAQRDSLTLITTEKDWVRLPEEMRHQVHCLPVALHFLNGVIPDDFLFAAQQRKKIDPESR